MKKTESKKIETKKAETKKPTVGTKRPFWDGRSRASTPGYRENYNSIFKQKRKNIMKTRYSGKSFKDSSTMKKAKLSFKEKRKIKREKKKK